MSLRCIAERAACSQHDIDPSRPPGSGSSCCTLFCSRLAMNILDSRCLTSNQISESLGMSALKKVLLKAVKDWDRLSLVDGAPAHRVLADCGSDREGFKLEIELQECFVSRSGLQELLCKIGDFAVLVTAIPNTEGDQQQRCGNTCVLLSLGDAVHLVDSHRRHPSGLQPAGMLRASVTSSRTTERAKVMCDWMWADDGFLSELRCNKEVVDVTVFRNKMRTQARPTNASANAVPSQGPATAASNKSATRAASSSQGTASAGATRAASSGQGTASAGSAARQGSASSQVASSQGSASSQGTGGAGQAVAPLRHVQDMPNHEQAHPTFVKGCAECRWRHNGKRWSQEVAFPHPITGQLVCPIAEKPASVPGPFAIGCVLSAQVVSVHSPDFKSGV